MDTCPIQTIKGAFQRSKNKFSQNNTTIRFYTEEKYHGVVPEPTPAYKYLPKWYQNTDIKQKRDGVPSEKEYTVRACMPFFDSLSMGWILPLPMDIYINRTENRLTVDYEDKYQFGVEVSSGDDMFGGNKPVEDAFLAKFVTPWYVDAPKGFSVMILPPLNRWGNDFYNYFMPFSGVFDADSYPSALNQFALAEIPEGTNTTIKSGTPIAQLVFMNRNAFIKDATVTKMSEEDRIKIEKNNVKQSINFHHYYENVHTPIGSTRNLPEKGSCPFLNK